MIRITSRSNDPHLNPVFRVFDDDKLAAICLQLCGGGYSAKQTRDAMILQDKLRKTGRVVCKSFTVEFQPEDLASSCTEYA